MANPVNSIGFDHRLNERKHSDQLIKTGEIAACQITVKPDQLRICCEEETDVCRSRMIAADCLVPRPYTYIRDTTTCVLHFLLRSAHACASRSILLTKLRRYPAN